MLIGVGAWTWASGNQVWNGNDGSLMQKPIRKSTKIQLLDVHAVVAGLARDPGQRDDVERVRLERLAVDVGSACRQSARPARSRGSGRRPG